MTEDEFYIKQEDLLAELLERKKRREEIGEKVDAFIYKKYGVENFCDLFYEFLGEEDWRGNDNLKSSIFLARAIPSFSLEDLYVDIFASKYDLIHRSMPLLSDSFNTSNEDKQSRIELLGFGDTILKLNLLGTKKIRTHTPVSVVTTDTGVSLYDWHSRKRGRIFKHDNMFNPSHDYTVLLRKLLLLTKIPPAHVYYFEKKRGVMTKGKYQKELIEKNNIVRPCASWYYPIFFCIFVFDNFLYDDYTKQLRYDSEFSGIVTNAFLDVYNAIGIKPLILKERLGDVEASSYVPESINNFDVFVKKYKSFSVEFVKVKKIEEYLFLINIKNYFKF